MAAKIKIRQSQEYQGDDWWSWAVWIEGSRKELDLIESVDWILHHSFPEPRRHSRSRETNFRLDTGGWGIFKLYAHVNLRSGDLVKLKHELELAYPDGTANTA